MRVPNHPPSLSVAPDSRAGACAMVVFTFARLLWPIHRDAMPHAQTKAGQKQPQKPRQHGQKCEPRNDQAQIIRLKKLF